MVVGGISDYETPAQAYVSGLFDSVGSRHALGGLMR